MKERLTELIKKLSGLRDEALGFYLDELDKFTAADGNVKAVYKIGIVTDLDKHITNLELEIKRMAAYETMRSVIENGEAIHA